MDSYRYKRIAAANRDGEVVMVNGFRADDQEIVELAKGIDWDIHDIDGLLCLLGMHGWELVSTCPFTFRNHTNLTLYTLRRLD